MCAAPGSKTTQLVEMLHAEEGKIPGMLSIYKYYVFRFILEVIQCFYLFRRSGDSKRFE